MRPQTTEDLDREHCRLNPDLVRASESDLCELRGYGEAAPAYELERRERVAAPPPQSGQQVERDSLYDLSEEALLALEELIEPVEELPQSDRLLRLVKDALRVKSRLNL